MRTAVFLVITTLFPPAAFADAIGVFTAASGEVQILRGQHYLGAAAGVDIERDDIVETGTNASAQLDMEDGSVLRLGPQTRLALSDYRLDANKNVVSAALDVLSGWMRFAVARLKPEGSYNIHTPVLTIGVRGTEGTIEAENERGGLHLAEGAVDVAPVGGSPTESKAVRVNSGEYVQRLRGAPLTKHAQPPTEFHHRMPPIMRERLIRRAHELQRRGVPPRVIRQMSREDAKHFLQRHPHMRERMRHRFGPAGAASPGKQAEHVAPRDSEEAQRRHPQMREKVSHQRRSQTGPRADQSATTVASSSLTFLARDCEAAGRS